jgi:hypothetical protein
MCGLLQQTWTGQHDCWARQLPLMYQQQQWVLLREGVEHSLVDHLLLTLLLIKVPADDTVQ